MFQKLLFLTAVLVVAAPLSAQTSGNRYALLVGVENYEHPQLRGPVPLQYCVEDVTELGGVLRKEGYEVTLLTDETGKTNATLVPTRANIETHLTSLLARCKHRDTIVLAFAGHGLQFTGGRDAYFCPKDGKPFADETQTLLSISKLYRELEKSFAGVKVILVDACRNDPDPGRNAGLSAGSGPTPPGGVAVLFSCSAGQKAYEHDRLQHGVFFYYVLLALKGKARDADGEVTFESLAAYVRKQVPRSLPKLFPATNRQRPIKQNPNMKADLTGLPPVLIPKRQGELSRPGLLKAPFGEAEVQKACTRWAAYLQTKRFITNSIGMKLALIPTGEFLMGTPHSEVDRDTDERQQPVGCTLPFWAGQYEVTQAEFATVMGKSPAVFAKTGSRALEVADHDTSQFPVENVSWYDAVEFCIKLSERENLSPCYRMTNIKRNRDHSIESAEVKLVGGTGYRLLNEAEWEYCCRAGTTTATHFGQSLSAWQANFSGDSPYNGGRKNPSVDHPTSVGSYQPNAFGLYDCHGNVWEWCEDWYNEDIRSKGASKKPRYRVARGGCWSCHGRWCRSGNRNWQYPSYSGLSLGFRVMRMIR